LQQNTFFSIKIFENYLENFVIVCGLFVFFFFIISVLLLEIQLSVGEGGDPIDQFKLNTFLCLSQARTWISNVLCHGLLMLNELRWGVVVCFVDTGGIIDHHFLFIMILFL